jgi:hypothetical protein
MKPGRVKWPEWGSPVSSLLWERRFDALFILLAAAYFKRTGDRTGAASGRTSKGRCTGSIIMEIEMATDLSSTAD